MYCPSCGASNSPGMEYCYDCGKMLPVAPTSARCPFCGADGQEYKKNCTKCGADLRRGVKVQQAGVSEPTPTPVTTAEPSQPAPPPAAPPIPSQPALTKHCPICGRPMGPYASMCDYCAKPEPDYTQQDVIRDDTYVPESKKPEIAGGLILVSGILGIIQAFVMMGIRFSFCCAGLFGIFGIIAIAGSFSALNRGGKWFAVIGAVFGILAIGFGLGAILALVAIVLIAMASNEFSE